MNNVCILLRRNYKCYDSLLYFNNIERSLFTCHFIQRELKKLITHLKLRIFMNKELNIGAE